MTQGGGRGRMERLPRRLGSFLRRRDDGTFQCWKFYSVWLMHGDRNRPAYFRIWLKLWQALISWYIGWNLFHGGFKLYYKLPEKETGKTLLLEIMEYVNWKIWIIRLAENFTCLNFQPCFFPFQSVKPISCIQTRVGGWQGTGPL